MLKLLANIAVTLAVLAVTLSATKSFAGSATWRLNPISSDWDTAGNWMPRTVPDGPADIATFGFSNINAVSVSANTTVSDIVFNSGAAGFTVTANPGKRLSLNGSGIINNSGVLQNLVATTTPEGVSGVISFINSATAGSQSVFTADGSTADQAFAGRVQFFGTSSAADGAFIVEGSQPNSTFGSGLAQFHDQSTAANGVFNNLSGGFGGGVTTFLDSATSIIIMLLAAPNIVRFPAIVLAAANIIHWLTCASPPNPLLSITKLYMMRRKEHYLVFGLIEY